MTYCTCEKPPKFFLPKAEKRKANGDPWEACGICKYPINPSPTEENSMSYELARGLLDSGFPLIPWWTALPDEDEHEVREIEGGRAYVLVDGTKGYLLPTLSELIEACGEQFFRLSHSDNTDGTSWDCESWNAGEIETGQSPEEAVARLWLALNEKS